MERRPLRLPLHYLHYYLSWATRIITVELTKLEILSFRNTKRLVDIRDNLNKLIVQGSTCLFVYKCHEVIRNCLAVLIQLDKACRCIELESAECIPELHLAVREVAINLFQRQQCRLSVHIIGECEERWGRKTIRKHPLLLMHKFLPDSSCVAISNRTGRSHTKDVLIERTFRTEYRLINSYRSANELGLTAKLHILFEEVDTIRSTQGDVDRVDIGRHG